MVCILTHGEKGIVFGTDKKQVSLQEVTQPFKSGQAPTLTGKPKLFFIEGSPLTREEEEEDDRPVVKQPRMQVMGPATI